MSATAALITQKKKKVSETQRGWMGVCRRQNIHGDINTHQRQQAAPIVTANAQIDLRGFGVKVMVTEAAIGVTLYGMNEKMVHAIKKPNPISRIESLSMK